MLKHFTTNSTWLKTRLKTISRPICLSWCPLADLHSDRQTYHSMLNIPDTPHKLNFLFHTLAFRIHSRSSGATLLEFISFAALFGQKPANLVLVYSALITAAFANINLCIWICVRPKHLQFVSSSRFLWLSSRLLTLYRFRSVIYGVQTTSINRKRYFSCALGCAHTVANRWRKYSKVHVGGRGIEAGAGIAIFWGIDGWHQKWTCF